LSSLSDLQHLGVEYSATWRGMNGQTDNQNTLPTLNGSLAVCMRPGGSRNFSQPSFSDWLTTPVSDRPPTIRLGRGVVLTDTSSWRCPDWGSLSTIQEQRSSNLQWTTCQPHTRAYTAIDLNRLRAGPTCAPHNWAATSTSRIPKHSSAGKGNLE
jgi:hypothetical protein